MGGSKGHLSELDQMLEEYYQARGWENGVVPQSKLEELGLPLASGDGREDVDRLVGAELRLQAVRQVG